jgi:hypothetical protein
LVIFADPPPAISWPTVVVSALAVVVSGFTAWYQWLRPGRVKVIIGDLVQAAYNSSKSPRLNINVAFVNDGARGRALVQMRGRLAASDGSRATDLKWRSFRESRNIAGNPRQFEPSFEFAGWVQPVVVPPRSSEVRTILFSGSEEFILLQGEYDLVLQAVEANGSTYPATARVAVSPEQAPLLSGERKEYVADESGRARGVLLERADLAT